MAADRPTQRQRRTEPTLEKSDLLWSQIGPFFETPETFRGDLGTYRSVMQFQDGRLVRTAADWQERRREILTGWHEVLRPWPPLIAKPGLRFLEKERTENFTRHKVEIEVAPGRSTTGYLLLPEGNGPFPAVLDVFYYPEDGAGLTPEKRLQHDFGYQMARRGFVALCIGQQPGLEGSPIYYPNWERAQLQPLSYLAYVAANCYNLLASLPDVDPERVGVVGHSYGGKWALFAACLYEPFACVAVSDPGIVFDESRPNVNYWEPWYLGYEPGKPPRKAGIPTDENPRTGAYKQLIEAGQDLHELHALLAPRPFFVAAGSEDPPSRWQALNHTVGVHKLLGADHRVGMAHRPEHPITPEANAQICGFFEYFLG
ncbi:MAG TPA: alpha/beta fold hydrolase [Chthonomonadaceae bacterium]|nr:alpha/beta fold hydrolase [Chthonomonadaceae bacterium]